MTGFRAYPIDGCWRIALVELDIATPLDRAPLTVVQLGERRHASERAALAACVLAARAFSHIGQTDRKP